MSFSSSRLGQRPALVGLFALNALVAACSDDDAVGDGLGGSAGSAGSSSGGSAGSASGGSAGTANAGTAGSSSGGAAGSGSGGSANAGTGGAAGSAGAGGTGGDETPDAGGPVGFTLSSPAFDDNPNCGAEEREECDLFPNENTNLDAENVSPELNWVNPPDGTVTFAIALHDLAFLQNGDPFTHWVMWNIPGTATGLPAELPEGVEPGVPSEAVRQVSIVPGNGFAGSGACGNVYEFVLYALDSEDFIPDNPDDPDAVELALQQTQAQLGTATLRARSDPNGPSCGN